MSSLFLVLGNIIRVASLTLGDSDGVLHYVIILSKFGVKILVPPVLSSSPSSRVSVYRFLPVSKPGTVYYAVFFSNWNANGLQLAIITSEGRFILWVVAVTCAQLQLNLRIAVYHIPEYMTTYSQHQTVFGVVTRRSSVDTFTTTEPENRYDSPPTERLAQEERRNSHGIELVMTSVHITKRTMGSKNKIIIPSSDIEQASF